MRSDKNRKAAGIDFAGKTCGGNFRRIPAAKSKRVGGISDTSLLTSGCCEMGFSQGSEAVKEVSQQAVVFYREAVRDVRLEVRTNNWVKVPIGQKHWSVRS